MGEMQPVRLLHGLKAKKKVTYMILKLILWILTALSICSCQPMCNNYSHLKQLCGAGTEDSSLTWVPVFFDGKRQTKIGAEIKSVHGASHSTHLSVSNQGCIGIPSAGSYDTQEFVVLRSIERADIGAIIPLKFAATLKKLDLNAIAHVDLHLQCNPFSNNKRLYASHTLQLSYSDTASIDNHRFLIETTLASGEDSEVKKWVQSGSEYLTPYETEGLEDGDYEASISVFDFLLNKEIQTLECEVSIDRSFPKLNVLGYEDVPESITVNPKEAMVINHVDSSPVQYYYCLRIEDSKCEKLQPSIDVQKTNLDF